MGTTGRHRYGAGAAAAAVLALAGCGAVGSPGPSVTEERAVTGAAAVRLATSGNVTIEEGDEARLTVTAGQNVIDRLTSDVHDGVLVLGISSPRWGRTGPVEYHLTLPQTQQIEVDGSGWVVAQLPGSESLAIDVDGSGDVDVSGLDLKAVTVEIDGSGDVTLVGAAAAQRVTIAGSGHYGGGALRTDDAVVVISGSGDAQVQVRRSLDAEVRGSGSVFHTGGARVSSSVSGSGSVEPG